MRKVSTVGIVKVEDEDVAGGLGRVLSLIGGLESLIIPLDNVLIKPNWATDKDYTTGAVTHPEVIKECARLSIAAGARKIIIGDSSFIGKDTNGAIEVSGLTAIASKRVEIRDFKKSEYINVVIPNAIKYRRLSFPKEVLESQVIINIPVMKTHDSLPVTLGLKNMKGVLADRDKRRLHGWGIDEGMIDLNRVVLPDLTIIDGIIGMEGDGPLNGTPVGMNVLIASFDPLAAEVTAIKAMGFDPSNMQYIQMAYDAGFGQKDLDKINFIGERIDDIKKSFKSSYYSSKSFKQKGISIEDHKACSACRDVIYSFVKESPDIEDGSEPKVCLVAGAYDECISTERCSTIGIGNCLIDKADRFDVFVPGCPPQKRNIKSAFQKMTYEE